MAALRNLSGGGTSSASNYAEARGAESDSDFVHRLKLMLKELDETLVSLSMLVRGKWFDADELNRDALQLVLRPVI